MTNPINFVPAASVTINTVGSPTPVTYAMPAVDANNVDLQVTADGATTVCIAFAAGASVGPEQPGSLVVKPGQSALVTAQAALLARPGNPPATFILPQGRYTSASWVPSVAAGAATATQCSIVTVPPGGTITITRGTATPTTQF